MTTTTFSYPLISKIIAAVALVLAILFILGVAASANLLAWAVILACIAIIVG